MTLFNIIYFVAFLQSGLLIIFFPGLVEEWLMWFADDARVLRRVASELVVAEACHNLF